MFFFYYYYYSAQFCCLSCGTCRPFLFNVNIGFFFTTTIQKGILLFMSKYTSESVNNIIYLLICISYYDCILLVCSICFNGSMTTVCEIVHTVL